jgi:hypothetical protein
MSSKAAAAVYPNLAAKERTEPEPKRDRGGKPEWGKSSDPAWLGPQPPIPPDYSKVPGLVRKANR